MEINLPSSGHDNKHFDLEQVLRWQVITFSNTVSQTFIYNIWIIVFKASPDYRFVWGSAGTLCLKLPSEETPT